MNMLDYARDNGVPVWNPVKLLDFLRAKDEAAFTKIKWKGKNKLSFKIKSALNHGNKLSCMISYSFDAKKINEITINGIKQAYLVRHVKGFDYAFITIKPGSVYRVVVTYLS